MGSGQAGAQRIVATEESGSPGFIGSEKTGGSRAGLPLGQSQAPVKLQDNLDGVSPSFVCFLFSNPSAINQGALYYWKPQRMNESIILSNERTRMQETQDYENRCMQSVLKYK